MRPVGASGAATRARIEEAAVRLFAERGFAATGIRELARAAGVTSSALYAYMGTKEELLAGVMRDVLAPLAAEADAIAALELPAPDRLVRLVERHVALHVERPLAARVADSELRALTGPTRAGVIALRDAYESAWVRVIADGVADGSFAVADPRIAAIALLRLVSGVSDWYAPGGRLGLPELVAAHADLCLGALRARG